MATYPYSPSSMRAADYPGCGDQRPCEPAPECPACGGLQTLCRPRFFAGQLLTEDDLNRLDRYMTDKNRLHNRHLHGWGVACGLEVVCAPCQGEGDGGKVLVRPGYALSPCGNDIVVPAAKTVDVCELIDRCRPQRDPCFTPGADDGCRDAEETWILAICYHEQTAREVAALRASRCNEGKQPAGQCGCNGQCGGDCGCGGAQATAGKSGKASKYQPQTGATTGTNTSRAAQCEPTVVCEGYCFRAYKVPPRTARAQPEMAALVKRFVCCVMPFIEDLGGLPAADSTPAQLQQWLANLKEALRQFLMRESLYDCEVARRLGAIGLPAPNDPNYTAAWTASTIAILAIVLLVLQKCLCAALLPPCPAPAPDDCVPIATITVGRSPCRVIKVCNQAGRRFLLTWPNVHYWLSWIPFFGPATGAAQPVSLRDLLIRLCCSSLGERFTGRAQGSLAAYFSAGPQPVPMRAAGGTAQRQQQQEGRTVFASLLASALADHPDGADLGTLLLAAIGAPDAKGEPLMSELEMDHPGEFELMNELLVPLMRMTVPGMGGTHDAMPGGRNSGSDAGGLQSLREELAALGRQVKQQQATIDQLSKRLE
ncbi:hypothetical protein [Pseudoduganella umbonata]|uniref:Uncharacterized protein n=1 Tax=Pseudoduganella umbonata TaxID=864828 RepID=A0A4P8HN89_9BURK|nr:hypothetical protein [Pseudoduganella umbonata]MBB3219827.1 hypothetical protein [Pseudoduganella umbonata]QCP09858.1 hypothetical protein FCL38_05045 [Pseudoduganella umbonata]